MNYLRPDNSFYHVIKLFFVIAVCAFLMFVTGCTTKMKQEWTLYETDPETKERVVQAEGKCKAPGQWCIQAQALRSGMFNPDTAEKPEPVKPIQPMAVTMYNAMCKDFAQASATENVIPTETPAEDVAVQNALQHNQAAQVIREMGRLLCPAFVMAFANGAGNNNDDMKEIVAVMAHELGPKPKTDFAAMQRATLAATQSDNQAKAQGYRSLGAVGIASIPYIGPALAGGSGAYGSGDSFGDVHINSSPVGRSGTRVFQNGPSADGGSAGGEDGGAGSGGAGGTPTSAHQEGMIPFTGGGGSIVSIGGHGNHINSQTSAGSAVSVTDQGQYADDNGQTVRDHGVTQPAGPNDNGNRSQNGILPGL